MATRVKPPAKPATLLPVDAYKLLEAPEPWPGSCHKQTPSAPYAYLVPTRTTETKVQTTRSALKLLSVP